MAASLKTLVDRQQQEIASLQRQLTDLTAKHRQALLILADREREAHRLYDAINEMRDQSVARDLELAQARQALQTSESGHDLVEAKNRSRMFSMEQQVESLQREVEDGHQARARLREEHEAMLQALREQILSVQTTLKEEQARNMALREREHLLEDKCALLQSTLSQRDTQMDTAARDLTIAHEEARQKQEEVTKVLALREAQLSEVQAQVQCLADAEGLRSGEHRAQLATLMTSFTELRTTCETQASEVATLSAANRRFEADKARLKTKLKELAAVVAAVQADRDRAHEGMTREIAAHHATQMQLTLAQHRVREAALRTGSEPDHALLARPAPAGSAATAGAAAVTDLVASDAIHASKTLLHSMQAQQAKEGAFLSHTDAGHEAAHHQPSNTVPASQAALRRAQAALDECRVRLATDPSLSPARATAAAAAAVALPAPGWQLTAAATGAATAAVEADRQQGTLKVMTERLAQLSHENAALRSELAASSIPGSPLSTGRTVASSLNSHSHTAGSLGPYKTGSLVSGKGKAAGGAAKHRKGLLGAGWH